MEKERQEKRTKWQRGTRGGNREKIDATREIKWETRKTRGNYFLFLYLKKTKPTDWYFILCSQFIKILI